MLRRRGLATSCPFCGGEDLVTEYDFTCPGCGGGIGMGSLAVEDLKVLARLEAVYCHACGAERETTWNMTDAADWSRSEALPQPGVLEVDYQDPFTTTMDGDF